MIGANGSGKSTFARMLNGLVVPTSGRVRVDGLDTAGHGRDIRRRVGFCFTDPDAQIVMPTVAEDIGFGLRRRGLSRAEITDRVEQALLTYELADHADHPAHLLSGGQKQLLALAAVLVTGPRPGRHGRADDAARPAPTPSGCARSCAGLEQQVVLVTHHLDLVDDFDRALVFDDGRLVFDGMPSTAVAHYRQLVL